MLDLGGLPCTASLQVWGVLNNAPYKFYLTGSRYFGNAGEHSDWDFFTDDVEGIGDFLTMNEFRRETANRLYKDNHTMSVWKHRAGFHIQVVKNAAMKLAIQEILKPNYMHYLAGKNKQQQREFWDMAFKLYGDGLNAGLNAEIHKNMQSRG